MMLSALWRHQAPWSYAVWLALSLGGGVFWSPLGLVILWGGAACISWELVARAWAQHRGFRVLYVLPCPSRWARLRLRHLGYTGPVAARLWEMHVAEGTRWSGGVAAFRHAYTADRARWLRERPSDVGLIVTTFNRLPVEEQDLLASADAWMTAGALHPRIARAASGRRIANTQRRMFGRVVSVRDRTNPTTWTTVYVPPAVH